MASGLANEGGPSPLDSSESLRGRYFQKIHLSQDDPALDRDLVRLVIERAKKIISHPSRPRETIVDTLEFSPHSEIALDETFDENPSLSPLGPFMVECTREKPFSCVAMLDSSSSMSGEKHLLSSVAVAVMLLKADPRLTALVSFAAKSKVIKAMARDESVENTLLRFLKVSPRGFTNISAGLEEGLRQLESKTVTGRRAGIIATDGRATEGGDPLDAAGRFDALIVLHLHGPGSHIETSRAMAQKGHGVCLEVERFDQLPNRLYEAIRILSRQ